MLFLLVFPKSLLILKDFYTLVVFILFSLIVTSVSVGFNVRALPTFSTNRSCVSKYRMAGNFGGNLFWWIAEISVIGGIYFGGLAKPVA